MINILFISAIIAIPMVSMGISIASAAWSRDGFAKGFKFLFKKNWIGLWMIYTALALYRGTMSKLEVLGFLDSIIISSMIDIPIIFHMGRQLMTRSDGKPTED